MNFIVRTDALIECQSSNCHNRVKDISVSFMYGLYNPIYPNEIRESISERADTECYCQRLAFESLLESVITGTDNKEVKREKQPKKQLLSDFMNGN